MDVCGDGSKFIGNAREREIVCGHDADSAPIEQRADQAFGAEGAIVRVRATEQLIEQEEHGLREIESLLQAKNFGHEAGVALGEGIDRVDRRAE